jgi:hypothetical protein
MKNRKGRGVTQVTKGSNDINKLFLIIFFLFTVALF